MVIPSWLLVALVALSVARLTHLVIADMILDRPRTWLENVCDRRRWDTFRYFMQCPWCLSIWLSAIVAAPAVLWPTNRVILWGLIALAASELTGLTAAREEPASE